MDPSPTLAASDTAALPEDFSLEMTGKDVAKLAEATASIPPGTRINITFLENEDLRLRLAAAVAVRESGFVPVPHISARRLRSADMLEQYLAELQASAASDEVFVVGGDPASPLGPYPDALSVIRSGLLERHGVRAVGVAGYPEGHPAISEQALWSALADKTAALGALSLSGSVITQFGFDAERALDWIEQLRTRGIDVPVRVGVPGPAGVRRLLGFAARMGVGTSAGIARKYGLSLTNLMGTTGPERFLRALAAGHDTGRHGDVRVHFYTFGGVQATAEWVAAFRKGL